MLAMPESSQTGNNASQSVTTPTAPSEDPRHTPIIDARLTELVARFGDRFDDDQRAQVRSRIARTVSLADSLRKLPLTNADEPEIVFVPYRED
jgi:hypothetical protein